MKAPRINFAPGRRTAVSPALWAGLILACGGFLLDAWLSARTRAQQEEQALMAYERAASAAVVVPTQPLPQPQADTGNTRQLSAAHVLRAVEAVRLPGTRLSLLSIDVEQGVARIEIELADIDQIGQCLEIIKKASAGFVWKGTGVQAHDGRSPNVLMLEAQIE